MPDTATTPSVHGVDATAVDVQYLGVEPVSPLDRLRQIRLRHQLVPYPVVGLLWAGAAAAHAAPNGAPIAVGVALVVAVVWWAVWGRRNKVTRRTYRRYSTTITLAGTAWLLWAATTGAGDTRAAVLWIAGYALALPWWRRHTIPVPPAPAADEPPVDPPAQVVPAEPDTEPALWELWAREIARDGGPAPKSWLTDHESVPQGDRYTVMLYRQKASSLIGALEDVGAALGLREGEIALDKHPSRQFNQAQLLITDTARSPLYQLHRYPGPEACFDPETGKAWIGVRIDGQPAYWDLIRPGWGVCGGIVIGATGGGKSRLLDGIVTTAAYAGPIVVWIGDPQGGASMPAWTKRADWSGTDEDEVTEMLVGGARAVTIRSKVNALYGRSLWTPTAAEPMLLLIVDECHKVLTSETHKERALRAATTIAREGRKAGVALILATQDPGLNNFGGVQDAQTLRGNLLKGNGACFRTPSNAGKAMMPGLDVNPAQIPDIPGVMCLVGSSNAPLRDWFLEDDEVEQLSTAVTLDTLEKVTAAYLGDVYAGRHTRREATRGALAAEILDLDPELVERITAADPSIAAALAAHQTDPRPAVRLTTPARTVHTGVVLHLAPAPRLHLPTDDTATKPKTTATDRIYELIRNGVTTPRDLIKASDYSESHVHNALKALEKAGRIRNAGHGKWVAEAA